MECPICKQAMKKVSWSLTSNAKAGKDLREYDHTMYQCVVDDVWLTTEIPTSTVTESEQ